MILPNIYEHLLDDDDRLMRRQRLSGWREILKLVFELGKTDFMGVTSVISHSFTLTTFTWFTVALGKGNPVERSQLVFDELVLVGVADTDIRKFTVYENHMLVYHRQRIEIEITAAREDDFVEPHEPHVLLQRFKLSSDLRSWEMDLQIHSPSEDFEVSSDELVQIIPGARDQSEDEDEDEDEEDPEDEESEREWQTTEDEGLDEGSYESSDEPSDNDEQTASDS